MPSAGDQHNSRGGRLGIRGLFEEPERQVSPYTAQEIATLQSRLEKQLGPEYISSRSGPGGQKVHYVAAEKCIQLANAVFGFNGWSSQIIDFQVDFVDENPQTFKVSLGLSVVVRVTLKDGTFHEDIGYGHIENCKGKAAAFEKAKKEGTTDALKRALRNFGNVLGNCIYDKEYLQQVSKVKPFSPKWSEENLFRHESFVVPSAVRKMPKTEKEAASRSIDGIRAKAGLEPGLLRSAAEEFFEDDFGDFDEADFGVADPGRHPDEVVLSERDSSLDTSLTNSPTLMDSVDTEINNNKTENSSEVKSLQTPTLSNEQPAQKLSKPEAVVQSNNNSNPKMTCTKSNASRDTAIPRNQIPRDSACASRPLNQPNRVNNNNQVSTSSPSSIQQKPFNNLPENETQDSPFIINRFFSARAATLLTPSVQNQSASLTDLPIALPPNAPLFNPHAESPSIRKTPGVDHKSSKPLSRDLKHVLSPSQASPTTGVSGNSALGAFNARSSIFNPSLDNIRRIGAPGSPGAIGVNSGKGTGFKIPMKRVTDGGLNRLYNGTNRVPLETLNSNGTIPDVVDSKRQKLQN